MQFTVNSLMAMLPEAVLSGSSHTVVEGMSIDTRSLARGNLFISIRGERFDGDNFVERAWAAGAPVCIGTSVRELPVDSPVSYIRVSDGLEALQRLAKAHRSRLTAPFVGVTGSNGKTTVKEMTGQMLTLPPYNAFRNKGNLNGQIGVALSILEMTNEHRVAILESGISHPGEMARLLPLILPQYGVLTNIGPVHIAYFESEEHILAEKGRLLEALPPDGVSFVDGDDPRIVSFVEDRKLPHRTVGFSGTCAITATELEEGDESHLTCQIVDRHDEVIFTVSLPFGGRHNVKNFLLSYAVVRALGMRVEEIQERASRIRLPGMRQEIIHCRDDILIINDTYNASPLSMKAAFDYLTTLRRRGRRIAIVGEMLELGDNAAAFHHEVGAYAIGRRIDQLVTVGQGGSWIAEGATRAARQERIDTGMTHFATKTELEQAITTLLRPGDTVLIKASRGIALDTVTTIIRENLEVK